MKNLSRLTGAANRLEHGQRRIDRRRLPQCATDGCRRRVMALKDGHIAHCDRHRTEEEWQAYYTSWCGEPPPEPEDILNLLSEGLD